jgi:hypothetical protein
MFVRKLLKKLLKITTSRGISRFVFLFDKFVIKFPYLKYGMRYFVMGMYGNLQEHEYYNIENHPNLGKVYYCAPFGLFLIMKRYHQPLNMILEQKDISSTFNMFIYPEQIDNNGHNIFYDNYNLILVDYGNCSLLYVNNEVEW